MALDLSSVISNIEIQGLNLEPFLKPLASSKTHFLAGAGIRGMEIDGNFIVFTVPHVYLEESAVQHLAGKWKGKTADELAASEDFYHDIITGPFEKFVRVVVLKPIPGEGIASTLSQTCIAYWKESGINTEVGQGALEQLMGVFKPEMIQPNTYVLYTFHPSGSAMIAFSKDGTTPESWKAAIQSEELALGIMGSMLGKGDGPPALRSTVASRLSEAFKLC